MPEGREPGSGLRLPGRPRPQALLACVNSFGERALLRGVEFLQVIGQFIAFS
jgi:hypothetical protein